MNMWCCSLSFPSPQVGRCGKPTWRRLAEAVQDPMGGDNHVLAQKIAPEHPSLSLLSLDGNFSYMYYVFSIYFSNRGHNIVFLSTPMPFSLGKFQLTGRF